MVSLERLVTLEAAYDLRHPDPKKDCGVHGVTLRMVLKGPGGAAQFVLFTNWQLPLVQEEMDLKEGPGFDPYYFFRPLPVDVGFHSLTPLWENQKPLECEYLDGRPCYYDGSTLMARDMFRVLLERGSEGVWEELEKRFQNELGAT